MYCKNCGAQIPDDSPNMLCDACAQAEQQAEQHEKQQDFVEVAQVAPAQPKKKDVASLIISLVGFIAAIIIFILFTAQLCIGMFTALEVHSASSFMAWAEAWAASLYPYAGWGVIPLVFGIVGVIVCKVRSKTHNVMPARIFAIVSLAIGALTIVNALSSGLFLDLYAEYVFEMMY